MRPARRSTAQVVDVPVERSRLPVASFVAQVIAQLEPAEADMRAAAGAYAAIDAMGYELPKVLVATL